MRSKLVWVLVCLNVVLLSCLVGHWVRPNIASAQPAPRPSDYILIPGQVQGNQTQVIYMIDTQAGLLSARFFDGRQVGDMRPIDLNRIFNPKPAVTPKKR